MILENKTVVVTGGGNGMGRELSLQLLTKGAKVAAVDINEAALKELTELAGNMSDRLSTHIADITDPERVTALPAEIIAKFGDIHVLLNNAGIVQPFIPVSDLEEASIRRIMEINFFGPLSMIRAFLPYLAEQDTAYIANVSSMGGFLPVPGQTIYGASKAAVKLLTEGLRAELSKTHIGVSVVFPGGVSTNITGNSGVKTPEIKGNIGKAMSKLTTPQQAAKIMIRGIEKEKPRILVGRDAKLMDFLSRFFPKQAAKFMSNMMSKLMKGNFSNTESLRKKD